MDYIKHIKISNTAKKILADMGGNAEDICTGDCTTFAKRLIDEIGEGEIVNGLNVDMEDEISNYAQCEPENRIKTPHCWVKIDGILYDAYDPQGVKYENDLEFYQIWA